MVFRPALLLLSAHLSIAFFAPIPPVPSDSHQRTRHVPAGIREWLGDWAFDPKSLVSIRDSLREGAPVVIESSLRVAKAQELFVQLAHSPHWSQHKSINRTILPLPRLLFLDDVAGTKVCDAVQRYLTERHDGGEQCDGGAAAEAAVAVAAEHVYPKRYYQYQNHAIYNASHHPPAVAQFRELFSSPPMLEFMAALAGIDTITTHNCNPSWYQVHDHITVHNDLVRGRRLSYILYLSKPTVHSHADDVWQAEYGGRLIWCDPSVALTPSFNTLVLFPVSPTTYHLVEPVWDDGRARIAISGFYFAH
jgi:hypothetical protein